jgi:hypothetical protein
MKIPMLLAADPGAIIAVIFGLISFIGWIINKVNETTKPPPPRRRQPRDKTVQDEIDAFLNEKGNASRTSSRSDVLSSDQVELIEDRPKKPVPPPRPKPQPQPQAKRPKPAPTPKAPVSRPQPVRPATDTESSTRTQHPGGRTSQFGKGVKEHAAQLGQEFKQQVKDDMARRIAQSAGGQSVQQSVASHLGQFMTADAAGRPPAGSAPNTSPALVLAMLKNPKSAGAALVVSEILAPPLSRRRGR